jgi:hypothetical protein
MEPARRHAVGRVRRRSIPGRSGELAQVDGDDWTFTPVGNLNGDVQLSYHLELAGEMSNTATVLVSLAPVNDAPEDVVVEVANKQSGSNGAGGDVWRFYFTDLIGASVDVDGDPLSISQSSFTGLTNGFSLRGTGANERLQINRTQSPCRGHGDGGVRDLRR